MNVLDLKTVLFSYTFSNAICALVIGTLWLQNRRRYPGLGYWAADFFLQFLAILLIVLRGVVPELISTLAGNPLLMGGTVLLLLGLERYAEKPSPRLHHILFLAAYIFLHGFFTVNQPSLAARNLIFSSGLLILCLQCVWLLLRRVNSKMMPGAKVTGAIFAAFSLLSLGRIVVNILVPPGNDLFTSGLYDTLAIAAYQMLFILLTFALVLMVNRRLFAELEQDTAARQRAEDAQRISEEKFVIAFQTIPDALIITSMADGTILEANESFHRLSEYPKAEVIGKSTIGLNLWGAPSERDRFVEQLKANKRVHDHESLFRRKSGVLFPGLISGVIIQLPEGICVLNVIHDISERRKSEETVQRNERMYRSLFENMLNGFAYCQMIFEEGKPADFLYLSVNRAFETLTGLTHVTGRKASEVVPGIQEKDPGIIEMYGRVAGTGQPEQCEIFLESLHMWFSLSVYCPEHRYFVAVFDVITERKQAEELLCASEVRYRRLFESAKDGILILDAKTGVILDANPYLLDLLEFSQDQMLGKRIWDLGTFKDVAASQENFSELQKNAYIRYEDLPLETAGGRRIPVEFVSNMYGVNHKNVIQCNIRNITERKQAEAEIERLASYPRLNPNPVLEVNYNGQVVYANQSTRTALSSQGLTDLALFLPADLDSLVLRTPSDTEITYEREVALPKSVFAETIHFSPEFHAIRIYAIDVTEQKRAHGRFLDAQTELRQLLAEADRSHQALLGVIEDQKLAEDEIRKLNTGLEERVADRTEQLEAANRELEAFAYSVSHDLRAPLRGIDGWSLAVLEDYHDLLDEQGKQYLEFLRAETQRMGRLIDDLLNLSRVSRTDLHKTRVDLTALARSVLGRLQTADPGRVVETVLQPGLTALGDPSLLDIMLTNLFSNAWKFTGGREPARIEFGQETQDGRPAFFVRDNGAGFDMAYARKLFGVFQRMHNSSEFPGTGVGLATVQRIIHKHGGRVWAEAQVNQGATFFFTLEEAE